MKWMLLGDCVWFQKHSLEVTPCLPAVRSRAPLSVPITLNSSVRGKQEQASGSAVLQLGLHPASHVPSLQLRWGSAPTHSVPHPRPGLSDSVVTQGLIPGGQRWLADAHPTHRRPAIADWGRDSSLGAGWDGERDGLGKVIRDWDSWEEGVNWIRGRGESLSKLGTEWLRKLRIFWQNFPWMISFSFSALGTSHKDIPYSFSSLPLPPFPKYLSASKQTH